MNKQTSEKEQDIKNQEPEVEATQEGGATEANANMAEEEQAATDNMSVEPSLEEQLAVWRDKYLRLQAEFDNFRKRTIKEKMELVERGSASVAATSVITFFLVSSFEPNIRDGETSTKSIIVSSRSSS